MILNIINQDLSYAGSPPVVYAVQGDNMTREVQMFLFSSGKPISIPEESTATIGYTRPDGYAGAYDSTNGGSPAYIVSGNSLRFFLAPEMLTIPGQVFVTIGVITEGATLYTFSIIVDVQKNYGLEPQSENSFKIAGTVADSGWEPNSILETDGNGNVVAKKSSFAKIVTVTGIGPGQSPSGAPIPGSADRDASQIRALVDNGAVPILYCDAVYYEYSYSSTAALASFYRIEILKNYIKKHYCFIDASGVLTQHTVRYDPKTEDVNDDHINSLIDAKNLVKTVNGVAPDENGNVIVAGGSGGVTDEYINGLVDAKLGVIENGTY